MATYCRHPYIQLCARSSVSLRSGGSILQSKAGPFLASGEGQTANSGQQQSISREKDCHAFGKVKGQGKPRKAEQFCVFRIAQRETTTKQTKGLALSIRLNTMYMYRVVKEKK